MQNKFDILINSYIENKVGSCKDYISITLATQLRNNIEQLTADEKMKDAGIGNNLIQNYDTQIRKDKIYWLDRTHHNASENAFLDMIDELVLYLNSTCYAGINSYEFHYALYEKETFYKKHLDQFNSNSSRKFSLIVYLNDNWIETDGGQLRIHHINTQEDIDPTSGKGVFFKSCELEHEVLISHKKRMSITGWLKIDH